MTRALVATAVLAVGVALTLAAVLWARGDSHAPAATGPAIPTNAAVPAASPRATVPPPRSTLRSADGRELVAGIGTRCWGGVCLDAVGPVSNVDPFPVARGQRLSISFAAGSPDQRVDRVFAAPSENGSRVLADGRLWETFGGPNAPAASALPPDLPSGRYVWVIQAFWNGKGDASYAFYIEIQ